MLLWWLDTARVVVRLAVRKDDSCGGARSLVDVRSFRHPDLSACLHRCRCCCHCHDRRHMQVHKLPTLYFVGSHPSNPPAHFTGLLPEHVMRDMLENKSKFLGTDLRRAVSC